MATSPDNEKSNYTSVNRVIQELYRSVNDGDDKITALVAKLHLYRDSSMIVLHDEIKHLTQRRRQYLAELASLEKTLEDRRSRLKELLEESQRDAQTYRSIPSPLRGSTIIRSLSADAVEREDLHAQEDSRRILHSAEALLDATKTEKGLLPLQPTKRSIAVVVRENKSDLDPNPQQHAAGNANSPGVEHSNRNRPEPSNTPRSTTTLDLKTTLDSKRTSLRKLDANKVELQVPAIAERLIAASSATSSIQFSTVHPQDNYRDQ